jgi:predicted nucleotidyltransferase
MGLEKFGKGKAVMRKMIKKTRVETKVIDRLVGQVVDAVRPLRVILFGSAARGDMGPDSDIDLLVVVPNGTDCGSISKKLYCTVGGVEKEFDLVVVTPRILEKYKDNCALVYKWALKEGREVYAA